MLKHWKHALGATFAIGLLVESIFAHMAKQQSVRLVNALVWCFVYTPTGMTDLRELGYSNVFTTVVSIPLGMLAAWTWTKLAYRGFDRFIHLINKKRKPLLTTPVTISEEDHSRPPYGLITLTTCFDLWAALGIARSHSQAKENVVTTIAVTVSILRNLFFQGFITVVALVSPFVAHHMGAFGMTLFAIYFATTKILKWSRQRALTAPSQTPAQAND